MKLRLPFVLITAAAFLSGTTGAVAQLGREKGEAFLAETAKKDGVKTLPSGLMYLVLKEGTGKQPTKTDSVVVHYKGTLIDGR